MRLAPLVCLALLAGCSEPDFYAFESRSGGPRPGFTAVAIWIDDSPVDGAERLLVTFDGVELDGIGLDAARRELDVLALRNGRRALLAQRHVPAGVYDRLRLRLATDAGAHRIHVGGAVHDLVLPRDREVLDIPGPFVLEDGATVELHVDFHARRSVLRDPAPSGDVWVLRPVATAMDAADGVFRRGMAAPGDVVTATLGGVEVATTYADPDGSYELGPLPVGAELTVSSRTGGG